MGAEEITQMNRIHFFAIALLAAGCHNDKPAETTTTAAPGAQNGTMYNTTPTTSTTDQPSAVANSISQDDLDFINKAAQGGLLEVQLGQVAARQGTVSSVKTMGQKLSADHSAAYDELKGLAAKKGLNLASTLDSDHQKRLDELSKMGGTKFDKDYADYMAEDHEKEVRLFEKAAKEANDPDVRAWANKTLPTLRGHLSMAQDAKFKTNK